MIAQHYPGWSLSEIRMMTNRQRRFWMSMIEWKKAKKIHG